MIPPVIDVRLVMVILRQLGAIYSSQVERVPSERS